MRRRTTRTRRKRRARPGPEGPPAFARSVRRRRPISRLATRGQRPHDPPLRLPTMKDDTGKNQHNRREKPDGEAPDETLDELLAGYTPKQRETFLKGFRILADVAVRAHIERQAPASSGEDAEPGPNEEEG